jgi:hypothetical protein
MSREQMGEPEVVTREMLEKELTEREVSEALGKIAQRDEQDREDLKRAWITATGQEPSEEELENVLAEKRWEDIKERARQHEAAARHRLRQQF